MNIPSNISCYLGSPKVFQQSSLSSGQIIMSKVVIHGLKDTKLRVSWYEELVFTITILSPEFAYSQEEGCSISNKGGKGLVIKAY